MKNLKLLLFLTLITMTYACNQQGSLNEFEGIQHEEEKKNMLMQMGFAAEEIQEFETYFLLQGDMVINKEDVLLLEPVNESGEQTEVPTSTPELPASLSEIPPEISPELLASNPALPADYRQRRTNSASIHDLINGNIVGNIKVQIDTSISEWSGLINQALNDWNNSGSKVNFVVVTSSPHITIYSDASSTCPASHRNLGLSCGRGTFPVNGLPGAVISINMDSPFIYTDARRLRTITHEFGHNLGLAHTNTSFGVHITGTQTTDAASVMNSGECGTIRPISYYDALAIKSLYPNCNNTMGEGYNSIQFGWIYNGGDNMYFVWDKLTWITVNANQNFCNTGIWFSTNSDICGTSGWFYTSTNGWVYSLTQGQWLNWDNC